MSRLTIAVTGALTLCALASSALAQSNVVISTGTYNGSAGADVGAPSDPRRNGGNAYTFSAGTLAINGGTFTGGNGATGPLDFSPHATGGTGGAGGVSLLLSGGTTTITGGVFRGGNGGAGGSGSSGTGAAGTGGVALRVVNSGTVANLYGGSFSAGSGSTLPIIGPVALAAENGGTINIFADPGTFALVDNIATGSFGGTPFSYRTFRINGGTIQGATAVVVPEAGTLAFVLPALGMIAFCNRGKTPRLYRVGAVAIRRRKSA